MIRTSKHILKFSNKNKLEIIEQIFNDYKHDLELYINDILSNNLPLKRNLSSKLLPSYRIKHSQYKQIIYKNASEIIRSNLKYTKNKTYKKYKKLYAICKKKDKCKWFLDKRFKDLNINYLKRIKINIKDISINLDNRLFDWQLSSNHFNEFIHIRSPYFYNNKKRSIAINLPIKYHRHSLKYKDWNRKNTIKLIKKNNKYFIYLVYEKEIVQKNNGMKLGIDLDVKKLMSCSNNKIYGKDIEKIYDKIVNKLRGSKNYNDKLIERTNKINYELNKMINDNYDMKNLYIEDLKQLRYKSKFAKKITNKQQYFIYAQIIQQLENKCEEHGIHLEKVSPRYTSQTCSYCGCIDKRSRNGESFRCTSCGYEHDADINASINILNRGIYNSSMQRNLES